MAAAKKQSKGSTSEAKEREKFDEKEECGICDKCVGGKDGIQCEICDKWHHSKCVGIAAEVYEFISTNDQTHWFCKGCNSGAGHMIKEIKRLQEKVEGFELILVKQKEEERKEFNRIEKLNEKNRLEISGQIEKVTREMKEIQKEMLSIIQKADIQIDTSVKTHEKKWAEVVSQQFDNELKSRATDVSKMQQALTIAKESSEEIQDKENRRNNIILYKVQESDAGTADERNEEDEKFCLKMFNIINSGVVKEDIAKVIRLGKRGDVNQPRPLLVKLEGRHPKNLIMENLNKLRHVDAKFKAVKVAHDLTMKERNEIRNMVQEAKAKTADENSGEWVHVVRGRPEHLKIIRVKKTW